MKMKKLEYQLRFLTPAFLGNAEQSGQWRTPPFKALLRQWWRVAYAADKRFAVQVEEMRPEEGLLFGHAWLEGDTFERNGKMVTTAARKSLVRMRLDRWDDGHLKKSEWPADATVTHLEVKNREGKPVPVGSALYQGFGPLIYDNQRRTTTLKAGAAIQAGESATLSLAVPEEYAPRIEHALSLMDRYGTLGGRSRNGWGSFSLTPLKYTPALNGAPVLRPWNHALALDWPHAIGADETGPLIWQTKPFDGWQALMKELAIIKIGLRTQFIFATGKGAAQPEERHWLSYPVTNHSVAPWGGNARLPNSLRFKVRAAPEQPQKLVGVIFHVPCLPPAAFRPDPQAITKTWRTVHALLDELTREPKQRGYGIIEDADRRTKLKPGLDGVTLQRSTE